MTDFNERMVEETESDGNEGEFPYKEIPGSAAMYQTD